MSGLASGVLDSALRLGAYCLRFARVERQTRHECGVRPETDSDHTVMLAVLCCAFAARLEPGLDIGKVAQLSIVHDLVEADAGDVDTMMPHDPAAKERREKAALDGLASDFAELPWVAATIAEYEAQASPEARFVKVMDKAAASLTGLLNRGAALRARGITPARLDERHAEQELRYAIEAPEQGAARDLLEELHRRLGRLYRRAAVWGKASDGPG